LAAPVCRASGNRTRVTDSQATGLERSSSASRIETRVTIPTTPMGRRLSDFLAGNGGNDVLRTNVSNGSSARKIRLALGVVHIFGRSIAMLAPLAPYSWNASDFLANVNVDLPVRHLGSKWRAACRAGQKLNIDAGRAPSLVVSCPARGCARGQPALGKFGRARAGKIPDFDALKSHAAVQYCNSGGKT
jgi:hypothetical protein